MNHQELRATYFGEVLCEQLEERQITPDEPSVRALARAANLDADALIGRMSDSSAVPLADLRGTYVGVAHHLELTDEEMLKLAEAYTFEAPLENSESSSEGITLDCSMRPLYEDS